MLNAKSAFSQWHSLPAKYKSVFGVDLGEYQKSVHTVDFLISS